jgi:uridine kinase
LQHYSQTLLNLAKKKKKGHRFILGIDGLSRSGKTTLAKSLCEDLKEMNIAHSLFHIDDHIVERKRRYNTGRDEWFEYYFLQWDLHGIKEKFFEKLLISKEFTLDYYDTKIDSQVLKNIELQEESIIIVEGVFLQRQEWRSFFDYVVFLDCPQEKRFSRESEETKKNLTKFQNRYWKAEKFYLKAVSPKKKADLVIKA